MSEMVAVWEFSCNVYRHNNVQKNCLTLQDKCQADIPLLLFACWAAGTVGTLSASQREEVKALSAHWQETCISPLRHIRQQMKESVLTGEHLKAPTTHGDWQTLREIVKSAELEAEKFVLNALERWSLSHCLSDVNNPDSVISTHRLPPALPVLIKNALCNIYCLFPSLAQDNQAQESVAVIVHAAYPQIQYDSVLEWSREYACFYKPMRPVK